MANNGYITKTDFLAALAGRPQDYELPGVGVVRIRPLSVAEVQALTTKYGDDGVSMSVDAVVLALVDPKLDPEDAEQLRTAAAGTFTKLAEEVLRLSGIRDDELEKKAGNGS